VSFDPSGARPLRLAALAAAAFIPTVLLADTATFAFVVGAGSSTSTANVDIGSNVWSLTKTILSSSYTLTLAGFDASGAALNLYTKDGGAGSGEQGIGFASTYENELTLNAAGTAYANFIRYDVSQVYKAFPGSQGQILAGSTTATEKLNVWGSNTLTSKPGDSNSALLLTINPAQAGAFVNLPSWGSYKYYFASTAPDPSAPADNTLVQTIDIINISAVPEPGTVAAAVSVGAMALIGLERSRRARRSESKA
jgi:hypothetical protein